MVFLLFSFAFLLFLYIFYILQCIRNIYQIPLIKARCSEVLIQIQQNKLNGKSLISSTFCPRNCREKAYYNNFRKQKLINSQFLKGSILTKLKDVKFSRKFNKHKQQQSSKHNNNPYKKAQRLVLFKQAKKQIKYQIPTNIANPSINIIQICQIYSQNPPPNIQFIITSRDSNNPPFKPVMWKQFLNQSRTERKFDNTPVIILGNRHSGKRSLVDTLFDISKTTVHMKRLAAHTDINTNKMKLRGLTPIIDYAYLNVLDIVDPDYRTHCKLEAYMVEDKLDYSVFSQLEKPELLKKAVVVIMLDFTTPWTFMEKLDGWIKFLYELQKRAGLSIVDLEEMAANTTKYYKTYKQPEFDQNGKIKKYFGQPTEPTEQLDIPLPEGVLSSNIRMPLIICVNKCDLQSSVIREQSSNKIQIILYHLRKFCVQYGATLVYTSIKNNSNLNVLYEYILHRAYKMPLRFKPETINEEAIFIPFGSDNLTLIQDSILKLDVSKSYAEAIPPPVQKKIQKEEVIVEDDSEYFKKYINLAASSSSTATVNSTTRNDQSSASSTRTTEVTKFFEKLLNKNNPANPDEQRRNAAQNDLLRHTTMQAEISKGKKEEN